MCLSWGRVLHIRVILDVSARDMICWLITNPQSLLYIHQFNSCEVKRIYHTWHMSSPWCLKKSIRILIQFQVNIYAVFVWKNGISMQMLYNAFIGLIYMNILIHIDEFLGWRPWNIDADIKWWCYKVNTDANINAYWCSFWINIVEYWHRYPLIVLLVE